MGLVRNIKLKMDMENYLLQHKIVALKIGIEDIGRYWSNQEQKEKYMVAAHIYFISGSREKKIGIWHLK